MEEHFSIPYNFYHAYHEYIFSSPNYPIIPSKDNFSMPYLESLTHHLTYLVFCCHQSRIVKRVHLGFSLVSACTLAAIFAQHVHILFSNSFRAGLVNFCTLLWYVAHEISCVCVSFFRIGTMMMTMAVNANNVNRKRSQPVCITITTCYFFFSKVTIRGKL